MCITGNAETFSVGVYSYTLLTTPFRFFFLNKSEFSNNIHREGSQPVKTHLRKLPFIRKRKKREKKKSGEDQVIFLEVRERGNEQKRPSLQVCEQPTSLSGVGFGKLLFRHRSPLRDGPLSHLITCVCVCVCVCVLLLKFLHRKKKLI